MGESRTVYLTDVDAAAADDCCERRHWFERYEGGSGIQPKSQVLANQILQETQKDLRTVGAMPDLRREVVQAAIDDILKALTAEDKTDQEAMELLYRRLGWLAAFAIYIEPTVHNLFEEMAIPDEVVLDREPLWVVVQTGRLLRSRFDQKLIYREFVPTGSTGQRWLDSWYYSPRMQLGIAAVQEELKIKIDCAQVVGIATGFRRPTTGQLSHPYVSGYYNKRTGEWTHSFTVAKGESWVTKPVWEYERGVVDWVVKCGAEVASGQFPVSGQIPQKLQVLEQWVSRRLHRERMIDKIKGLCGENMYQRGLHFPMKTAQCAPAGGTDCPFLAACWNLPQTVSPLTSGAYVQKVGLKEMVAVVQAGEAGNGTAC